MEVSFMYKIIFISTFYCIFKILILDAEAVT